MKRQVDRIGNSTIFGIAIGVVLCGCAGLSFPYRYFDPVFVSYDGTLLGPKPSDDLPGSVCAPSVSIKHPCVIMKSDEFFQLKKDYLDKEQQLIDCQKPKP